MPKWVRFTKRTDEPKLTWLEEQLGQAGITHQRNGFSFHAPILEVQEKDLEKAWEVLDRVIKLDGKKTRIDDVPDDHTMFKTEE